jgi:hypothetical protein
MTGWGHAAGLGMEWALSMDGDGQHDPEDIPRLLHCAAHTGARLVVGDRMSDPHGMPWARWLTNRWMSRSISRIAGRPLPDTQNGFRLMHLPAWQTLKVHADHFEIESEVLVKFVRGGFQTEFVPVRVIYGRERSKIHPWRDAVRWWRWRRRLRECAV